MMRARKEPEKVVLFTCNKDKEVKTMLTIPDVWKHLTGKPWHSLDILGELWITLKYFGNSRPTWDSFGETLETALAYFMTLCKLFSTKL